MLNSALTVFAVRRVSVLMPIKPDLSNPGDEKTITFFRSREAFGNFLIKERCADPMENFVEIFLLKDFRIIPATLSCIRNEAVNNVRVTAITRIANILSILKNSFMYKADYLSAGQITVNKVNLFE